MKKQNTAKVSGSKRSLLSRVIEHKHMYIILLPTILFYLIFRYIPMFGNIIAFQDYSITKGLLGSKFVGLEHFRDFLSSYKFFQLLRNTLAINSLNLLFGFPIPIIFALLLNEIRNLRFKKTVQTVTYMPHFISTVIMASLILSFVSVDGMINGIRAMFGLEPIAFMANPKYFWGIYVASNIWQGMGWNSIIYIATISSIDPMLYEAATIDGANRFQQMRHITIPGISETIVILLILNVGQMLSLGYEKIILLYNPSIYETADVISTFVYRRGLLQADYGYSTAVSMFNAVINFILIMIANTVSKKVRGSGLW